MGQTIPEELLELRNRIDQIDDEIMSLLGSRFDVTRQVGKLKAENRLESFDPAREKQKLKRLEELAAEYNLDADFVLKLFQSVFREVVENHKQFLSKQ